MTAVQNNQHLRQYDGGYAGAAQVPVYSRQKSNLNQSTRCASQVGGDVSSMPMNASNSVSAAVANPGNPASQDHAYRPTHPDVPYATYYNNQAMVPHPTQQQMPYQHMQQPIQQQQAVCMSSPVVVNTRGVAQPAVQAFHYPSGDPYLSAGSKDSDERKASGKNQRRVQAINVNGRPTRKRHAAFPPMEFPKGEPTAAELALVSQYEPADHIAGVRFSPNKRQWLAAWSVAPGKEVRKHFSVVQKGYGEAWRLAVLCRWEAERNGARIRLRTNGEVVPIKRISTHCSPSNSLSDSQESNSSNFSGDVAAQQPSHGGSWNVSSGDTE